MVTRSRETDGPYDEKSDWSCVYLHCSRYAAHVSAEQSFYRIDPDGRVCVCRVFCVVL